MTKGSRGSVSEDRVRSLLAFLNTRACPACRAGEALGPGRTVGPAGDDLRQFRDDLAALLEARIDGTRPAPGLVRRANRRLRRAVRVPQIAWTGGTMALQSCPLRSDAPPDEGPGPAADWILLVASPRPPIDRCAAQGCRHFFLRWRSNQRWCSPEGCGNRARVARHHLQRPRP